MDLGNLAGAGGTQLVLHLHRLHDRNLLALCNIVALLHVERHECAWHWGEDKVVQVALGLLRENGKAVLLNLCAHTHRVLHPKEGGGWHA